MFVFGIIINYDLLEIRMLEALYDGKQWNVTGVVTLWKCLSSRQNFKRRMEQLFRSYLITTYKHRELCRQKLW
jgi:hypothetical protein